MSTRYIVRAPDRSGQGHDAVWTPGRRWPGGKDVEVEVLDQDECPDVSERISQDSEEKRTFPHPTKIGRKAWERIRRDPLLTVRPVGDTPAEAVTLQASLAETQARLADALERVASNEARANLAEREVVKLGEALEASNKDVAELHEALDAARVKVAELEGQLEQLTAPASPPEAETAKPDDQAPAPAVGSQGKGKNKAKGGG
jgi:chromosome segregation ATPase